MAAEELQIVKPYHQTNRFSLYEGDCRSVLPIFAECSIDSIVCDPPYELGFMSKTWDRSGIAYDVSVWQECLRVLKPGGHLLAFGGSRTYHRLACAIEDAGFEIRDQIQWIYGSGFPKSLDISKKIDARGGVSVAWFGPWLRAERERRGITQKALAEHFPSKSGGLTGCVANWELGLNMPTPVQFNTLCSVLGLPFARLEEAEREVIAKDRTWGNLGTVPLTSYGEFDVTAPASNAARQWSGWGTALKPAHEPIVLARKPLIGTVAENVLQHGTGGLNIDGCRIGDEKGWPASESLFKGWQKSGESVATAPRGTGRWPANVIHDGSDEVLAVFPDAPGQQAALNGTELSGAFSRWSEGLLTRNPFEPRGDSGSAARFFYCAKATQDDRNEGCEDLPHRVADDVHKRPRTELDDPRRHGVTPRQNNHPTVKPTDLMRYLCRLVTPPGGLVLDPFCGSGSTGKAAMLEGLRFIGIELSADYCQLAQRRIEAATKQGLLFT